jgi:DNA repair photolyase
MRPSSVIHRHVRQTGQDGETPLFKMLAPSLPMVERVIDSRPLLRPTPLTRQGDVLALDFIGGCGHGCPFCPARVGGDGRALETVRLADQVEERLTEELLDLPRLPTAVFVSPTTDPFPPLREVQEETNRIVDLLGRRGIDIWLMTRGFIRPAALEVLRRHAKRVKVTVALTTLDRPLQRALEPLSAPPRLRLKTIHSLREMGIACNAALEPLIPGVTDTRENLLPILDGLSAAGIQQVTVGYLVLHQRNEQHLQATLRPLGLDTLVMEEYVHGPILRHDRGPSGRYLPRPRRQHGYAALMAMAASFGLRVSVNALTNPDFAAVQAVPSGRTAHSMLSLSNN